MVKRFSIIFIIVMLYFTEKGVSQDAHFSQFYANPLYLNPAFAGSAVCPRAVLNFRQQWPDVQGTYVTYSASYDQHFESLSGGLGILVNTDRQGEGALNTTQFSGIYAYSFDVTRDFSVKAGIQATFFQKSLDWGKLRFPDQLDPKHGFVYQTSEPQPLDLSVVMADFSAGILGYSDRFYIGFATHHLTTPNEGFTTVSRLPRRYTAHVGAVFSIESWEQRRKSLEEMSVSPNIMYMHQDKFHQLNYGMYFNRFPFVGGMWFRQNFDNPDALVFLVGVQQKAYKFGYSYDLTVSQYANTGGAHEFSFAFKFQCPTKKHKIKPINCPTF